MSRNYSGLLDSANYKCRYCAEDGICDFEVGVFDEDPTSMDENGYCTDQDGLDCEQSEGK